MPNYDSLKSAGEAMKARFSAANMTLGEGIRGIEPVGPDAIRARQPSDAGPSSPLDALHTNLLRMLSGASNLRAHLLANNDGLSELRSRLDGSGMTESDERNKANGPRLAAAGKLNDLHVLLADLDTMLGLIGDEVMANENRIRDLSCLL